MEKHQNHRPWEFPTDGASILWISLLRPSHHLRHPRPNLHFQNKAKRDLHW